MQITHLGHSALLVADGDTRLLIDPGTFADGWAGLTGLDAILVTHQHPDHFDVERLPALLADNPDAAFVVEAGALDTARGLDQRAQAPQSKLTVGAFEIEPIRGDHAVIHRDLPTIGNCGYVIRSGDGPRLFHPGDALTAVPPSIDILALPVMGPWAAMKEHIDFTRAVGAQQAIGIHGGLVNDTFWAMFAGRIGELTNTEFRDLRGAGPTEFS